MWVMCHQIGSQTHKARGARPHGGKGRAFSIKTLVVFRILHFWKADALEMVFVV